tara:strand:+ start:121 stop:816 length:696 start_codon:yes stop_codon:yes gene_type:complete
MASIRFNQIADARGSINGTVYSRGIGGLYMKNRVSPVNPQTAKQTAVRAALAALATSWRGLSDDQRTSFKGQVANYPATNRLGETYTPSGYQLYMTLNGNLSAVNTEAIEVPIAPVAFSASLVSAMSIVITAGAVSTGTVSLDDTQGSNETILIEMTGALSAGVSAPSGGLFRRVLVDATETDSFDIAAAYTAIFGVPAVGSKIFARVFKVNVLSGQRASAGATSIVVTAA